MSRIPTIIQTINDPKLFRSFLSRDGDLKSWRRWLVALRVLYGLPIRSQFSRRLVEQCTGRDPDLLPNGFRIAAFLVGRRGGKSQTAALVGAYEALTAPARLKAIGRELAPGEEGVVAIYAPKKDQARKVTKHLSAIFSEKVSPALARMRKKDRFGTKGTQTGFPLTTNIRIEIQTADWRTARGDTLICAILDEAAFLGYADDSKVKNDSELIKAIRPALLTTQGKLIIISSPYAKKGWCYEKYRQCFGNDRAQTLVWNCPTVTMNPTLTQEQIDAEIADDPTLKYEYEGLFQDDIMDFITREMIEQRVKKGRKELSFSKGKRYRAFVDLSGGRSDDAALAIGHKKGRTVVVDVIRRYVPPFNPFEVIGHMCGEIQRYELGHVTGDNYAAEFVAQAFRDHRVAYTQCPKPKSQLYREWLPRLTSDELELLDDDLMVTQFVNLERRIVGGKEHIDHPNRPGYHDDVANVVAGVTDTLSGSIVVGAL